MVWQAKHSQYRELIDVNSFQERFQIPMPAGPTWLPQSVFDFRTKFLQEELNELTEAIKAGDMLKAADALVDLEYVLKGTVLMMGLTNLWPDLWEEVHRCNMNKVRVDPTTLEGSKRKNSLDVVKPPGWRPPQLDLILPDKACWRYCQYCRSREHLGTECPGT